MNLISAIGYLTTLNPNFEYIDNSNISFHIEEWEDILDEDAEYKITVDNELINNNGLHLVPNYSSPVEKFIENFIDGFLSIAETIPGYDYNSDCNSTWPWCTPWTLNTNYLEEWYDSSLEPFEMGKKYANSVEKELREVLKETETI